MSNPHRTPAAVNAPPPVTFPANAPSGLVGRMRKMKGAELTAAASAADDTSADGFDAILSPCWISIEDPGPYTFLSKGDARPDWKRVLKGDMIYLFLTLRRISMPNGNAYAFPVKCEECKGRYDWEVMLSDLPLQELPEDSIDRLRNGKLFEARIASTNARVTFDLMRSSQDDDVERLLKRLVQRGEPGRRAGLVDMLAAQTISIDGVGPDILNRYEFLDQLDIADLYLLHQSMQAADCGVDTAIQTKCTNRKCQWVQDINLPFGKAFFAPPRPPPRAKRTGSSGGSSQGSQSSGSPAPATGSGGTSTAGAATAG